MRDFLIRCSALGAIMTEPKNIDDHLRTPEVDAILRKTRRDDYERELIESLKQQSLSAGAKTEIRHLVKQEIFGYEREFSSKETEKGKLVEAEAIELLNRVRGLSLVKNTERRGNGVLTGEADCFDAPRRRGHDTKCPWSLATFPAVLEDCFDQGYFWQMQGYMILWDAEEWSVDYVMMPTPEHLIGRYEPTGPHQIDHLPEHLRVTSWVIPRDRTLERLIGIKVQAARRYAQKVIEEFDRTHAKPMLAADFMPTLAARVGGEPAPF